MLDVSLQYKVVVLSGEREGELFFCTECGDNDILQGVLLDSGEYSQCKRSDIADILKPESLTDSAKLQLSQIRPVGALDLNEHIPQYSGYSFLPDGRYASGVWLCSVEEVQDYVQMQREYQYRVMICDRNDFAVMELVEGKIVFPSKQDIEETKQYAQPDRDLTL